MPAVLRFYRLPSGSVWSCYGRPPSGAVALSDVEAEDLIAAAEGSGSVGSDVHLGDDGPETEQVDTGPADGGAPGGEDLDGDQVVLEHDGGA